MNVISRVAVAVAALLSAVPAAAADVNAGAKLVQANGCAGCHGAAFGGGIGPKLVGIEHHRSAAVIAAAIFNPKAPMPKFPFTAPQVADIVAYLSALDGSTARPVATVHFTAPEIAVLTVRFAGTPPTAVTALPSMGMSNSTMEDKPVTLIPSANRHVWRGTVHFSMGGAWTIDVVYGGKHLTVPVNVADSP